VVLNRYEKLSRNAFGHFMCEKRGEDDRKTRKVKKIKKKDKKYKIEKKRKRNEIENIEEM